MWNEQKGHLKWDGGSIGWEVSIFIVLWYMFYATVDLFQNILLGYILDWIKLYIFDLIQNKKFVSWSNV